MNGDRGWNSGDEAIGQSKSNVLLMSKENKIISLIKFIFSFEYTLNYKENVQGSRTRFKTREETFHGISGEVCIVLV